MVFSVGVGIGMIQVKEIIPVTKVKSLYGTAFDCVVSPLEKEINNFLFDKKITKDNLIDIKYIQESALVIWGA